MKVITPFYKAKLPKKRFIMVYRARYLDKRYRIMFPHRKTSFRSVERHLTCKVQIEPNHRYGRYVGNRGKCAATSKL